MTTMWVGGDQVDFTTGWRYHRGECIASMQGTDDVIVILKILFQKCA